MMRPPLSRFWLAAAILLLINLSLLAFLGKDADSNGLWIGLNLPGLPCGIGTAILGAGRASSLDWLEYVSFIVTSIVSSLVWAALVSRIAPSKRGN
jgi:hypothetical protein